MKFISSFIVLLFILPVPFFFAFPNFVKVSKAEYINEMSSALLIPWNLVGKGERKRIISKVRLRDKVKVRGKVKMGRI